MGDDLRIRATAIAITVVAIMVRVDDLIDLTRRFLSQMLIPYTNFLLNP